jgi:hypothetical protein
VQLRLECQLSAEQYVERRSWLSASLASCPLHPEGGCGFARHGSYPRREPAGARVRRYYCPTGKVTFSLLPDCLASRVSATLAQVESAVALVEACGSAGAAARHLHPVADPSAAAKWRSTFGGRGDPVWVAGRIADELGRAAGLTKPGRQASAGATFRSGIKTPTVEGGRGSRVDWTESNEGRPGPKHSVAVAGRSPAEPALRATPGARAEDVVSVPPGRGGL